MKARTLLFPAALFPALLSPLAVHAAPPDASAKPAPTAVAAPQPMTTRPAPKPTAAASPTAASPASAPPTTPPPGATMTPTMPPPGAVAAPSAALPGAVPPPGSPPTSKPDAAKLPAPKTPLEAALYGAVRLERAGKPIAVGTMLSGDGRILTALSPLTHGNQIDAHYPEGQVVHVKISYSDRAWDLALLTPEGDARHAGLKASHDPTPVAGSKLHTLGFVNNKLGATDLTIKAKSTLRGGDSAELSDALELSVAPKAIDIGAPLLDDKGEVVAVVARACSPSDKLGCTLIPYAAPVSAIRAFLRSVPMRRGPWLGVDVVPFDAGIARGVRVAALAPEGPAANAGVQAGPPGVGDVVLAVDGSPVSTAQAFSDALEGHSPGMPVRLLLLSGGRYREVGLMVREAPNVGQPAREDRIIRSNPSDPWPRAPRPPLQQGTPNPYR